MTDDLTGIGNHLEGQYALGIAYLNGYAGQSRPGGGNPVV